MRRATSEATSCLDWPTRGTPLMEAAVVIEDLREYEAEEAVLATDDWRAMWYWGSWGLVTTGIVSLVACEMAPASHMELYACRGAAVSTVEVEEAAFGSLTGCWAVMLLRSFSTSFSESYSKVVAVLAVLSPSDMKESSLSVGAI